MTFAAKPLMPSTVVSAKQQCVGCSISAATLYIYGFNANHQQATIRRTQTINKATDIRSQIGRVFELLPSNIVAKLREMAKLWGEGVSQQNISDAFVKIGFTRKKRPTVIKNEMSNNAKPL
ncbi:hypothetical protein C1752_09128 [Acaryochloris thomasi RCC1774]|uniref:Uncharacterized protein n=1 Tax=Acaryochloris thomasi RCC1774 TaxID=1764569 RepID=A0A2W1JGN1_9CYAN|nr:hypothetical protein C1752_09128 [Acaryochloris thomasi RCC1774]